MSLVRYVFFRVYSQQIRVVRIRGEAAFYSVMYMALGPQCIVMMLDWIIAAKFGHESFMERWGEVWVIVTYFVMFACHWLFLVRAGKAESIYWHYAAEHQYDKKATILAHAYIFVPALAAVVLAKYYMLQR